MKRIKIILLSLYAFNSLGQSITLLPEKQLNTSSLNAIIVGKDTLVSNNYKFLLNNTDENLSPTIGIFHKSTDQINSFWRLRSEPFFNGMELGMSSNLVSVNKPIFSISMPLGKLNISNTGSLQLGLNATDTSKVFLSIKNKAAKVAFSNSGTAIGLAQEIQSIVTDVKLNEVHGLYSYADSANFTNSSIFAETGKSGKVANIAIFGKVYNPPLFNSANSAAIYGQDDVNLVNTYAGFFNGKLKVNGNVDIAGTISKGAGAFKIDHPLDPFNKILMHSFVESPEMINIYNGIVTTNADSLSVVNLPAYFEALNDNPRYQLTVIGQFSQAIVSQTISNNNFTIKTDKPGVEVSWQVIGTRKDVYANENRIIPETNKTGSEIGTLLYQPQGSGGTLIWSLQSKLPKAQYQGTVRN